MKFFRTNDNIGGILLGFVLCVLGFLIFFRSEGFHTFYGFHVSFGPYHRYLGISIFVIGLAFIFLCLTAKARGYKEVEDTFVICPKCRDSFYERDVKEKICPKCKIKVEDVKGFYERHPDLKEEQP